MTILGRYLSAMKLNQWKDYRWKDSQFLQDLQNKKIEPWITSKITGKILEEDQPSLIREIANGNTDKILEITKELGDLDNEVSSINLTVDGNNINTTTMTGQ